MKDYFSHENSQIRPHNQLIIEHLQGLRFNQDEWSGLGKDNMV